MSNWIEDTLQPNGVLKNKLSITDESKLAGLEYRVTAERSLYVIRSKPKVKDLSTLPKIHEYLFGPLYEWAGQYRQGNFTKGGNGFLPFDRFEYAETDINQNLNSYSNRKALSKKDYAVLLDNINFMHPFREGNGRSTRLFLQCYAANHHQVLDYPRHNKQMIKAENDADVNKIASLINIDDLPSKDAAYRLLYQRELYNRRNLER